MKRDLSDHAADNTSIREQLAYTFPTLAARVFTEPVSTIETWIETKPSGIDKRDSIQDDGNAGLVDWWIGVVLWSCGRPTNPTLIGLVRFPGFVVYTMALCFQMAMDRRGLFHMKGRCGRVVSNNTTLGLVSLAYQRTFCWRDSYFFIFILLSYHHTDSETSLTVMTLLAEILPAVCSFIVFNYLAGKCKTL